MKIELTPHEARIIGCLLEKEFTTPDQYPLTISSLTAACNQKSNRDPVLNLDGHTVQQVVDELMAKHLVSDRSSYGGRVPKYKHVFCNTVLGSWQFSAIERAIVCELLLRGPQSVGELRTRCNRMTPVATTDDIEAALHSLGAHPEGPFVVKLPRLAGTRDPRFAHLFCGEVQIAVGAVEPATVAVPRSGLTERVESLETKVLDLQRELEEIKGILASVRD